MTEKKTDAEMAVVVARYVADELSAGRPPPVRNSETMVLWAHQRLLSTARAYARTLEQIDHRDPEDKELLARRVAHLEAAAAQWAELTR